MTPMLGIIASQVTGHLVTGSYESIASYTVGSGGTSTISFTSIPSGYKHLQIRGMVYSDYRYIWANYNGDTGQSYTYHVLTGDGSSASSGANATEYRNYLSIGYNSTYPQVFVADILDYGSSTNYKTVRSLSGTDTNGSVSYITLWSGLWRNTNAITQIDLTTSGSPFYQYSSLALYGIKG